MSGFVFVVIIECSPRPFSNYVLRHLFFTTLVRCFAIVTFTTVSFNSYSLEAFSLFGI